MHRYSWEMFWVTFKPFLPSEVRSCNLSNMWEQKEINNSSSHLHTSPHYPFGKGSGKELQTSVRRDKHKERRALIFLASLNWGEILSPSSLLSTSVPRQGWAALAGFIFSFVQNAASLLKMSNVLFHITAEQNTFFYQGILWGPIFHCLDFYF